MIVRACARSRTKPTPSAGHAPPRLRQGRQTYDPLAVVNTKRKHPPAPAGCPPLPDGRGAARSAAATPPGPPRGAGGRQSPPPGWRGGNPRGCGFGGLRVYGFMCLCVYVFTGLCVYVFMCLRVYVFMCLRVYVIMGLRGRRFRVGTRGVHSRTMRPSTHNAPATE